MTFELDERHLGCKIFPLLFALGVQAFALFAPGELNRVDIAHARKKPHKF